MKYFRILSTSFSLLFTFAVTAQNGDSLAAKITDKEDAIRVFQQSLFRNPANYLHFRDYSLTEFRIDYNKANNNARLVQQGQNQHFFNVGADAYHKQGNSAMWGSAGYKQGKRENVQWNESADYDKIFPYVVADSVGRGSYQL